MAGSNRYIEDVRVGMELPILVKEPQVMTLVEYAGASRDFFIIHHDRDYAKSVGYPDIVVQGSLKAAYLGQLITDFIGDTGRLIRMSVQYRGIDVPGEQLVVRGVVTAVLVVDGDHTAECDIWIENPSGQRSTFGTATIAFPTRCV
ncbi:MAG: MaoC/PaaZ C-terminal domain-containing protein [Acidimicrobiia bacterium]